MRDLAEITGCGKPTVHRIFKSDLQMSKHYVKGILQDSFLVYYKKMTADTTQLVTTVHFPTSLIMVCAGGPDQ